MMFYNFLLQERCGEVKTIHKGPHQDLYEYKRFQNKKLKVSEREEFPPVDNVWKNQVNWKGFQWTIQPFESSRALTLIRKDEKGKIIRIPFPKELRLPEKKSPILYGGRLKLFYLCDQGVKKENNDLRYHETDEQQKLYCSTNFKQAMDHAQSEKPVEGVGKRRILPASFSHGKRCYSERYYDAMAVVLARQRPDLFITVTGTTQCHELERLRDGRSKDDLVDLANRIFSIKLKRFLHDVVKNQIFGRIVGEIWIIEYQKRGIPHAHICLCLDRRDKLKKGSDFERANDFVDQMIWAEIPVDDGEKKRPMGWRYGDIDRKDRWCYNEIVDPDRSDVNIRDDEDEEQIKMENLMEELGQKEMSRFNINATGSTLDNESDVEMEFDNSQKRNEPERMIQEVCDTEEQLGSDEENMLEEDDGNIVKKSKIIQEFCDDEDSWYADEKCGEEPLSRPHLIREKYESSDEEDDEDDTIDSLLRGLEEEEEQEDIIKSNPEETWKSGMEDPEDIEISDDDSDVPEYVDFQFSYFLISFKYFKKKCKKNFMNLNLKKVKFNIQ